MLNRAPTLHRLGIQAFEPVLVEGRAIQIHPLVCTAYNADFDGDQMAVHVPLSAEAQAEARVLMLSAHNILSPANGKPLATPTQDMVLGCYYLMMLREGAKGEGKCFSSPEEAVLAYENGVVELHARIKVREDGQMWETTPGRIIFNEAVPSGMPRVNELADKKALGRLIAECYRRYGVTRTAKFLDDIKHLGFRFATQAGVTISMSDIKIPATKEAILKDADKTVSLLEKQYRRGLITSEEHYRQVIDVWNNATEKVTDALVEEMDHFNPVYMMAISGARGNIQQIRQLAGMRGLMADPSGRIIDLPIKANFREGLTVLEYFISTHGARKGLADTALRTADSGYLTRRLVDVSQDVIVREEDCGTTQGTLVKAMMDGQEVIQSLAERIVGRIASEDIIHPLTGEVLTAAGEEIKEGDAEAITAAGITGVKIRSIHTCNSRHGICARCYGRNLATGKRVDVGEAIGIVAAQSIGEPGTQLTMRTFHTGGVAGEDITQGLPRVEELFEARRPKGQAIIAEVDGIVYIREVKGRKELQIHTEHGEVKSYQVPYGARIHVEEGQEVAAGEELTEGSVNPHELLRVRGIEGVQRYLLQEVQKVYRSQGVDINDKHIEVIVRQMLRKVKVDDPGDTELLPGGLVEYADFAEENARATAQGLKPATARPMLLGITKASLATESFLSAASFQETTRVLTDAAIKGKLDPLLGLKENVIIGKLVPAGTGMPRYLNLSVSVRELEEGSSSEEGEIGTPDFGEEAPAPETPLSAQDAVAMGDVSNPGEAG